MSWGITFAVLLLAGCAPLAPVCPTPPPTPLPLPPVAAQSPPAVVMVVRKFDAASAAALTRVVAPDISAAQIKTIQAAWGRARRALSRLGRTLPRIEPAVMAEARASVRALEAVLN
jgi:hypothetical protein